MPVLVCGITTLIGWGMVTWDSILHRTWIELTWLIPAIAIAQVIAGAYLMWAKVM